MLRLDVDLAHIVRYHLLVVKSYIDPADIVPPAPQAFGDAESQYRKSEDVAPELDMDPVAEPSMSALASSLTMLPTHAEDAGPVHEVLPPVYNPEWNSSSPRVV